MPDDLITFIVRGVPQTKGSAKWLPRRGGGKPIIVNDNPKTKPWANMIRLMAQQHAPKGGPWLGPVKLKLEFAVQKPKNHPKQKYVWAIKRPDADKLLRAAKDALIGVIYKDDAQVTWELIEKAYGNVVGVRIEVSPMCERQHFAWSEGRA